MHSRKREAQGNLYVLAPIPASLVITIAVIGFRRSRKTMQRLANAAGWVAEFGAKLRPWRAAVAVLLSVGSWIVFAVFFAISALIISLGDVVRSAAPRPV